MKRISLITLLVLTQLINAAEDSRSYCLSILETSKNVISHPAAPTLCGLTLGTGTKCLAPDRNAEFATAVLSGVAALTANKTKELTPEKCHPCLDTSSECLFGCAVGAGLSSKAMVFISAYSSLGIAAWWKFARENSSKEK